jgi:hypothetical protein
MPPRRLHPRRNRQGNFCSEDHHGHAMAAVGAALLATPAWAAQDSNARFKHIYTTEWAWRTGQAGVSASGEAQPNNGRL